MEILTMCFQMRTSPGKEEGRRILMSYPAGRLNHLELQRVPEVLIFVQCHSVTAGKTREHVPRWEAAGLWYQLWETSRSGLYHSPHIQALLCESSCLEEQKNSDHSHLTCQRGQIKLWWTDSPLTLSKQKRETFPKMLMRGGLMQKTPCFFSLCWA